MKILTFMAVGCLMATTAFAETSKDELKRLGDSDVIVNQLPTRTMAFQRITGRRRSVSSWFLSGGVLRPDKEAIERAYGPEVSATQVIQGTKSTGEAMAFLRALGGNDRSTTGRR